MKTIIQRNLPITQKYAVIGSFYRSIEEGGGQCCENCGRLITNVCEVQGSEDGKHYFIGMDCAETLTGIKGNFDFEYIHKANFQQAKSALAYIQKAIKKSKEIGVLPVIEVKTYEPGKGYYAKTGGIMIDITTEPFSHKFGRTWKQYPLDIGEKYIFPMIKDLVSLPSLPVAS